MDELGQPKLHTPEEILNSAKTLLDTNEPRFMRSAILEALAALEAYVQVTVFTLLEKKFALENAAYFDVVHKASQNISLRYGFRLNQFLRFKQDGLNRYINDNPLNFDQDLGIYKEAEIIGEYLNPNNSKTIKSFYNFEPRFNFSYNFKCS